MIGRFSQLGIYRELVRSRDFYRVLFAGGLAGASFLWDHGGPPSTVGNVLAIASVVLNGTPILWGALTGILKRQVNVDELVSLAIIASLIKGEYLAAAVVSFVMVLGALIEQVTSDSARRAIQGLISIRPDTATRIQDGAAKETPIEEVVPGDLLLVRPGERIPVDADIVEGLTAVDESSVTGEPLPKERGPGDAVFAGTLNQTAVLHIKATKVGADTTLGKVIALVTEAESHRPASVSLIDRYARWFTPAILICAAITWVLTGESSRAIAVLIVGCPCALILAAPTAIVASIARAAKSGILIKGGQYIEQVGRAQTVLFDKTGTLTKGKPSLEDIFPAEGETAENVLALAAAVEQESTHPLAWAILQAATSRGIAVPEATDMTAEIGIGIRARAKGHLIEVGTVYLRGGRKSIPSALRDKLEAVKKTGATPLTVYRDGEAIGILSIADEVRPGAADMVEQLRKLGVKRTGLLSGDHLAAARHVGQAVKVDDVWGELKPEQKLDIIKELRAQGGQLIYLGDGINDAPALAAADVGIAMGAAGTDVALETADIALMRDQLDQIPFLIQLSRRTVKTIKWNIVFGLAFNAFAVAASGSGYLSPVLGAVVHNIGSMIVVLSSASIAFSHAKEL